MGEPEGGQTGERHGVGADPDDGVEHLDAGLRAPGRRPSGIRRSTRRSPGRARARPTGRRRPARPSRARTSRGPPRRARGTAPPPPDPTVASSGTRQAAFAPAVERAQRVGSRRGAPPRSPTATASSVVGMVEGRPATASARRGWDRRPRRTRSRSRCSPARRRRRTAPGGGSGPADAAVRRRAAGHRPRESAPWPTSPNIIPNITHVGEAGEHRRVQVRVGHGGVGVDERLERAGGALRPRRASAARAAREPAGAPRRPPSGARRSASGAAAAVGLQPTIGTDRPVAQCGRGGPLELDLAGQFRKPAGRLELGDLGGLGEDAGLGWLMSPPPPAPAGAARARGPPRPRPVAGSPIRSSWVTPASATATSTSRSRSAGATTATRAMRVGSSVSRHAIEDLHKVAAARRRNRQGRTHAPGIGGEQRRNPHARRGSGRKPAASAAPVDSTAAHQRRSACHRLVSPATPSSAAPARFGTCRARSSGEAAVSQSGPSSRVASRRADGPSVARAPAASTRATTSAPPPMAASAAPGHLVDAPGGPRRAASRGAPPPGHRCRDRPTQTCGARRRTSATERATRDRRPAVAIDPNA